MDSKGVSPIVGIILAVAITVLLAVIAWTYLGGFTTTSPKMYSVAAKAEERPDGTIRIMYTGGPDQTQVDYLNVSVSIDRTNDYVQVFCNQTGYVATNISYTNLSNWTEIDSVLEYYDINVNPPTGLGTVGNGNGYADVKVGTTVSIKGSPGGGNDHVIVIATFIDGTKQVILDTWT